MQSIEQSIRSISTATVILDAYFFPSGAFAVCRDPAINCILFFFCNLLGSLCLWMA